MEKKILNRLIAHCEQSTKDYLDMGKSPDWILAQHKTVFLYDQETQPDLMTADVILTLYQTVQDTLSIL